MTSRIRWLRALLPAAAVLATAGTGMANTELVPAARLVAPYWDISGSRSTLLVLTNVGGRSAGVRCDAHRLPPVGMSSKSSGCGLMGSGTESFDSLSATRIPLCAGAILPGTVRRPVLPQPDEAVTMFFA
jgi:hypothetical protein